MLSRQNCADRYVAARQTLGKEDHVRLDVPVLHRKEAPGTAQPGLDLIDDEQGAVGTLRSAGIAHPVLAAPATLTISGWVELREERERSDRIVVRAHRVEGERLAQTLVRVRVAVRKGTAPAVGAFVEMRALGAAARSLASGRANTRP